MRRRPPATWKKRPGRWTTTASAVTLLQSRLAPLPTIAEIYRLHAARVLALASYLLPTRDTAEDAVADVFLRLPGALVSYDRSLPLERWLLRVTSNWCIDWLRRSA